MSEYTPTTAMVRDSYAPHRAVFLRGKGWYPDREASEEEAAAEFDRWLFEHDSQVAERAWDEGHLVHGADGWPREDGYCRISGGCIAVNPHRKEQEKN